jgi:hypothetical protein
MINGGDRRSLPRERPSLVWRKKTDFDGEPRSPHQVSKDNYIYINKKNHENEQPEDHVSSKSISNPQEVESKFEELWKEYPNKISKAESLREFKKAIQNADPEKIITGAKIYARYLKLAKTKIFTPWALGLQRWLREERWTDEYEINGKAVLAEEKKFTPTEPFPLPKIELLQNEITNMFREKCREVITEKYSSSIYETWIKPLKIGIFGEDFIEVYAPTLFMKNFIQANYMDCLNTVGKSLGVKIKNIEVRFEIESLAA